ncbi:hypothetical protein D9757_002685 [Collybiopsis confluens]|uniref:TRUD domain-containing protein n=1 Tax=Collybiopsis confluens TaxID=2823264 RepID=A0A8H5ME59_9AGAR|nr:hypothetical protein D9757_002685 [Collybiopsis confluens]
MSNVRERENDADDLEREFKRPKVEPEAKGQMETNTENLLPPSHSLLGVPAPPSAAGRAINFLETDVGISQYVGQGVSKIEGIIKQRFTDFLVNEVDLDGNVLHLKSLAMPESTKKDDTRSSTIADEPVIEDQKEELVAPKSSDIEEGPWPESFNLKLTPYLSETAIAQLKEMFLQGPEPPRIPDGGWGGRTAKTSAEDLPENPPPSAQEPSEPPPKTSERGKRERGRGRRGGRGGGRATEGTSRREDNRKVISEPMNSKETRTAFHQVIRELFSGKLDSETDQSTTATDDGSRIVVKWSRRGVGRGGRERDQNEHAPRGTFPPFIHFTLQKTNRDTQDALSHLSRMLKVDVKSLSVAGTKDKRGVTAQRVSLKRGSKTVEDVWRLANGVENGRKTVAEALTQRGERGVRVTDLKYRKAGLELGLLKGNGFVITLRSVQVDSMETMDKALSIVKDNGFINYYGLFTSMQRFGTASVPTHAIGLALLQSDWQKAASLILQPRHGEHPDVEAARRAWLEEKDLDKALSLMPRRVVAERCLLQSYKTQKGDSRNALGAISTIPRNLRLMYVHAYQSYVWNAVVSERIKMHGVEEPVVGDLVFEVDPDTKSELEGRSVDDDDSKSTDGDLSNRSRKKLARKPWTPPKVKTLTEEDVDNYSMLDVIMPLPGTDVAYPGGKLGDHYREFLTMDGLDPDNFVRKQKDYTLGGSYRKILHRPSSMTWSVMRYTDPDIALAQSDEDKLLGFDPPVIDEQGKFMALQIRLTLGTASYATMALQDQKYRGTADGDAQMENVAEGDADPDIATEGV